MTRSADDSTPLSGPRWRAVAESLRLYRGALIATTSVAILTICVVGYALLSHDLAAVQSIGLALPLAGLIASLVTLGALVRYSANLPAPSDASGPVMGAVVCVVLGVLTQIYTYSIAWKLHSIQRQVELHGHIPSPPDLDDLIRQAERLPWLELLATLTGLIALLLVLTSLRSLARWLAEPGLTAVAGGQITGFALLAVFAGGARLYIVTAHRPALGAVIVLGLVGIVWGMAMVLQLIGLLRDLAQVIETRLVDLPVAQVSSIGPPPAPPPPPPPAV